MNTEPKLIACGVREALDTDLHEFHIECRFSNGEKFAAVKVDGSLPELAALVCKLLESCIEA